MATATILPPARTTFVDANGTPLAFGKVYMYVPPNTTTLKTTWQDAGETTPNTNPIVLDGNGTALIYGSGQYLQEVFDSLGNLIWTGLTQDVYSLPIFFTPTGGTASRSGNDLFGDYLNILDFTGVDKTGITDSTAGIQAAITAAGINGTIRCPTGTYLLSSTLTMLSGQQLLGEGINSTIFTRTGDYGDTVTIGTATAGHHAGACYVDGIWFKLTPDFVNGSTSLTNLATSGAHLHLIQGQQATINNCWFTRMPYGVHLDGGANIIVRASTFEGVWDPLNVAAQEGIADIWIDGATTNCTLITIDDCYITAGGRSASRTYTYSCTNGNVNKTGTQAIGAKWGVHSTGCEGLLINGTYVGGNSQHGVFLDPITGSVNLELRITDGFFDSSGGPSCADVYFGSEDSGKFFQNVCITGTTFNGELYNQYAIFEANGITIANQALGTFSFTGNTFLAYAGTPIVFNGATIGTVAGNTFTDYNDLNIATSDPLYINAVTTLANAKNILFSGNTVGGTHALGGIYIDPLAITCIQSNTMFAGVTVAGRSLKGIVPTNGVTSILGMLKSADFNTTLDQAVPIILASGQRYAITDIWVTNASLSLTTAVGGFYSQASKGGTTIVANTQVYTACGSSTGLQRTTLAITTTMFTVNPVYLSLTTPQGAPATADVYVRGVLLT